MTLFKQSGTAIVSWLPSASIRGEMKDYSTLGWQFVCWESQVSKAQITTQCLSLYLFDESPDLPVETGDEQDYFRMDGWWMQIGGLTRRENGVFNKIRRVQRTHAEALDIGLTSCVECGPDLHPSRSQDSSIPCTILEMDQCDFASSVCTNICLNLILCWNSAIHGSAPIIKEESQRSWSQQLVKNVKVSTSCVTACLLQLLRAQ